MTGKQLIALLLLLGMSGCTTLRVQGMVYDSETSDGIANCGITTGPRYYHVDSAGHYVLKTKEAWKTMVFVAPGYETKTVKVEAPSRYLNINVPMVRKTSRDSGRASQRGSTPPE